MGGGKRGAPGGGRVCGGLPEVALGPEGVKEAKSLHNMRVM